LFETKNMGKSDSVNFLLHFRNFFQNSLHFTKMLRVLLKLQTRFCQVGEKGLQFFDSLFSPYKNLNAASVTNKIWFTALACALLQALAAKKTCKNWHFLSPPTLTLGPPGGPSFYPKFAEKDSKT